MNEAEFEKDIGSHKIVPGELRDDPRASRLAYEADWPRIIKLLEARMQQRMSTVPGNWIFYFNPKQTFQQVYKKEWNIPNRLFVHYEPRF